jgi:hypothetical protein
MNVLCDVERVSLLGDLTGDDKPDAVEVTCRRCGHMTESDGTSSASVRRCMAMLRGECPNGEQNYYEDAEAFTVDGADDDQLDEHVPF